MKIIKMWTVLLTTIKKARNHDHCQDEDYCQDGNRCQDRDPCQDGLSGWK